MARAFTDTKFRTGFRSTPVLLNILENIYMMGVRGKSNGLDIIRVVLFESTKACSAYRRPMGSLPPYDDLKYMMI